MSLLVTGGSGFVGRRVHSLAGSRPEDGEVVWLEHRWHGIDEIRRLVPDGIGACIHLAWTASTGDYLTNARSNLDSFAASIELARVLAERGCRHLVVAGSCAEYAESDHTLNEESPLRADSPYAEYKIRLHQSLLELGIPLAWARLFSVVGPGESPSRLMPWVARCLLNGTAVPLSPGDQVRDLIDVDDVVRALLALSEMRQVGVFNLCRGEPVVLRDFLLLLAELVHADPKLLEFGLRTYGVVDPRRVVGDPSRLQAAIVDWSPRFDTREIADRIVADATAAERF
jgi:nucleoside-diphosphate-sugar epimerase